MRINVDLKTVVMVGVAYCIGVHRGFNMGLEERLKCRNFKIIPNYNFDKVCDTVRTRDKALELFETMERKIKTDGFVTVADYYRAIDLSWSEIDEHYGWDETNFGECSYEQDTDGEYLINMSNPKEVR